MGAETFDAIRALLGGDYWAFPASGPAAAHSAWDSQTRTRGAVVPNRPRESLFPRQVSPVHLPGVGHGAWPESRNPCRTGDLV